MFDELQKQCLIWKKYKFFYDISIVVTFKFLLVDV